MKYRSFSHIGQRKINEDALYPKPTDSRHNGGRLYIVCDGIGGLSFGAEASRLVCQTIADTLNNLPEDSIGEETLRTAVGKAIDTLSTTFLASTATMGTTLAMAYLPNGQQAYVVHVGDSRVYHIRPGEVAPLRWQTRDHSLVQELIERGELTPEEAEFHPKKHMITKAILPAPQPRATPDIHLIEDLQAGDVLLLCTDGLLECWSDNALSKLFGEHSHGDAFVQLRSQSEGFTKDNCTAILVEF